MKILARVRKSLPFVGILEFEELGSSSITHFLRVVVFALLAYGGSMAFRFILFQAVSFDDITKAFSSFDIYVYISAIYVAMLMQQKSFSIIFTALEKQIEERRFFLSYQAY